MKGQHTQGRVYMLEKHGVAYLLAHGSKVRSSVVDTKDIVAANMTPANARRLAACWNAFMGLSTQDLESLPCSFSEVSVGEWMGNGKELAAARARIAELDAQLGKRPCQNSRCNELNAARALLQEVLDGTQPFISALECECDFDGEKWAEKARSFLEGK